MTVPTVEERPGLRPAEVARLLELAEHTVYEGIKSGEIPAIKVGRRFVVPCRWLRQQLHLDDA